MSDEAHALTKQGWQPVHVDFTVGIQKCQDFSSSQRGSQQPGPDEPFSFLGAHNPHLGKAEHVLLQLLF